MLVPNKAQLGILKFTTGIRVDNSKKLGPSPVSANKKRVHYEDEIMMEEFATEPADNKRSILEEFKTQDDHSMVKRSKSELYQGEKCVYDMFREAQSKQYYQQILSDYEKVSIGISSLFSSLDSGDGVLSKTLIAAQKRASAKVNIVGSVGTETYKKKAEDDDSKLILP